jgi:formylglycine-generating enzyme required for sulfatase activity
MRLGWRHTATLNASTSPEAFTNAADTGPPDTTATCARNRSALVKTMVDCHRSALLLRPKVADDITGKALQPAIDRFCHDTRLISTGPTQVERWQVDEDLHRVATQPSDRIDVDALFLERSTVTNEQFQAFVDQGGYQKKSLWHASVWPHVTDFIDRSGANGPRFWSDGRHTSSEADHPVVGVSWFEAEAYSRWIGMRLPTDAEWVRAACTPIETNGAISQRRYPWGDSFSSTRANLWGSGIGHTAPVSSYPKGDSLGGLSQMVGNVWEWTSGDLQLWNGFAILDLHESMKNLRGAAFDSYLDVRATCQCQSADRPLARKPNIGFRCAVSVDDVIDLNDSELESAELVTCEESS